MYVVDAGLGLGMILELDCRPYMAHPEKKVVQYGIFPALQPGQQACRIPKAFLQVSTEDDHSIRGEMLEGRKFRD